jgi:o-succinylbenzoate---CoA ligase
VDCPVARAARRWPEAVALVAGGHRFTYRALDEAIAAHGLAGVEGFAGGRRLASVAASDVGTLLTFFAAARAGRCWTPLHPRWTKAELAVRREVLQAVAPPASGETTALFTSGTTGTPRLVGLTRSNFEACAVASGQVLGAEPEQRWLGLLPLSHIGGLAMAYRCAAYGATLVLEPGFDARRVVRWIRWGGVTHLSLVPTTLRRVLDAAGGGRLSGLKVALIGGGPMDGALLQRARTAAVPALQTYGLTEACSQVCTEVPGEADGATAGPPLPGYQVRVMDERGEAVGPGVVGQVEVSSPSVAPAFRPWLRTGDLGALDEAGRLKVVARRVDVIITGGENVYPAEVEGVLVQHPGVEEVAVVPRPDEEWGQRVVAVVVPRGPPDEEGLLAFARERLASFKVPRQVEWRASLPRNALGKLLRTELLQSDSPNEPGPGATAGRTPAPSTPR